MLECVLTVTGTETHLSEKPYELRMNSVHADLQGRGLAFLLDLRFHFALRLADHLFDPGGMDPSIYDQFLKSDPCHLAANRIKTGNNDSFGRIVNNKINACHRLESADISTLTADDPALHLITGKLHDRDRRLGNMICSAALDRAHYVFLGFLVCFFLSLRLNFFDHNGGIMSYIVFNNF